jgi:hypothetical protein
MYDVPPVTAPADMPVAVANPAGTRVLALVPRLNSATHRFIVAELEFEEARDQRSTSLDGYRRVLRNRGQEMGALVERFHGLLDVVACEDPGLCTRLEGLVDRAYGDRYPND